MEELKRKYIYEYPTKFKELRVKLLKKGSSVSAWFRKKRADELKEKIPQESRK